VRVVFGIPGSHSTHLYDAINRHGGVQTILCRNEQAGAFMADGYARATGKPGVVCTTAGPGATHALSGIAEAYADSVPVLLISGQVNHDRINEECGRYHEIDLEGIFRPSARFSKTLMCPSDIPSLVDQAMVAMVKGRPGPAALFLPQDLMALDIDTKASASVIGLRRIAPDAHAIRRAREVLVQAQRPVILAGGGAIWSDAGRQIEDLANKLDCPVITTLNGKGVIDERSEVALGHGRSRPARMALARADAMLACGCRFTEIFTVAGTMPVPPALVQIDIDPNQIGMNYPVMVGIPADVKATVEAIGAGFQSPRPAWKTMWQKLKTAPTLAPEWFVDTIRASVPEDTMIFSDVCEMGVRMQTDLPVYGPRRFFYPSNYVTLGWGLPAAIGAAVAHRNKWIVCVAGDGGFVMTAQELATAARYRLKVIIIIHNDSTYGAIKNIQHDKHDRRYRDTELNNPDFLALAESFGVASHRAVDADDLSAAIHRGLDRGGPTLIEVPDHWRAIRLGAVQRVEKLAANQTKSFAPEAQMPTALARPINRETESL
jgi:acetolactate synthase-1/2/3 large subunit